MRRTRPTDAFQVDGHCLGKKCFPGQHRGTYYGHGHYGLVSHCPKNWWAGLNIGEKCPWVMPNDQSRVWSNFTQYRLDGGSCGNTDSCKNCLMTCWKSSGVSQLWPRLTRKLASRPNVWSTSSWECPLLKLERQASLMIPGLSTAQGPTHIDLTGRFDLH